MKNSKITCFWMILAIFSVCLSPLCHAEENGDTHSSGRQIQGKSVEPLQAATDEKGLEKSALQKKMEKIVSVNFNATSIESVIRTFADQGKIDIVKSPNVTGEVTALITDVPLGEALDNILSAHGYGYIESNNMIRIVPQAEIDVQKARLLSKVYRITYADVKQVEEALKKFVSTQGSISSNAGTSNIIITDVEEKIKAIDSFIQEIDRITPQILVEARIYDISSTDQFDLGIEWFAGRGEGRNEPFINSSFQSAIDNTTKTSLGFLEFGMLNGNIDIEAELTAKQDAITAKLLANPRILVIDNEKANIKIVSEIPFQELTQTAGGGNIGTTEFREVGVELEVVPHITRDGLIRLKIKPKFSVQVGSVDILAPGVDTSFLFAQPIIDSREAETTALIQDNQTVVIGGLRKKDQVIEESKIPLLGDIPLLGALFKFNGEKTVNSELVVFITPRIISDMALSERERHYLESYESETCMLRTLEPMADNCNK